MMITGFLLCQFLVIIKKRRDVYNDDFMSSMTPQITTFISSLETHPRATELIPLVEQLLNVEDFSVESQLVAILLDICVDNPALITELWLLRGTILLEEGLLTRAVTTFWEAVHLQPEVPTPWDQVIAVFIQREELIHASFFLTKAQLLFPDNEDFTSLLLQVSQQIPITLRNPLGVSHERRNNHEQSSSTIPPIESNSSILDNPPDIFPVTFHNPWKMMQECFKASLSSANQKDQQSFVTYAHSAIRELLGLDGNFRDGLDQVLIRLQLTDYKQPLMRMNHIRNRVAHANYIPPKKELRKLHNLVQEIVHQYELRHTG
ncbi:hypothetical protein CEE45_02850 [Candidatus Heimdallarchaeota archaeon B3_Heim]|nr:MAG: hypothetical protein CEE45_02850 [Candidatus Heimdallarchaeota archaeon B3_Heim]